MIENALASELQSLFAKAKMPSSPAIAARVLDLINEPNATTGDFGAVIQNDPALTTRLLKMANSSLFAQRIPVSTIERAVTVLGLNRVKTLSLGFQLIGHLDRLGGAPFDTNKFWQHSLLRACLAQSIAQVVVPSRAEEAFLVGLLQECGILLLVQVQGSSYASLYRSDLSPTAFHAVERTSFPHTHVDAISVMASEWNLPKIIGVPLARHHQRIHLSAEPSETERLSAVSYFVAGLRFSSGHTVVDEEYELQQYGAEVLRLDEAAWDEVQALAGEEYRRVATLYGNLLPEDVDVPELLSEANRQLAAVANDADQRLLDVESERTAILREQQHLEHALKDYRERSALDPLTNVLNRGALTEAVRRAIEQNLEKRVPIGIFFIDLDNFKRLNDTYGHHTGDMVLKSVAALLGRENERGGTVGRYGGEEFVVLLRGLSAEATREAAERIVERVRTLDSTTLGFAGTVTCSLGAVWSAHLPVNSAEELFAAADQLMYKAKRSGKDRSCFEVLGEPGPVEEGDDSSEQRKTSRLASQPAINEDANSALLEEMLSIASQLNANEVAEFVGIRKQNRKKHVVPCTLHYFLDGGPKLLALRAAARNISTGGIGILADRPMVRGEPVEVVLGTGNSKLFLAGLIAFCRHIDARIHEVGVQFVSHSVTPIISGDTEGALHEHDWIAQALSAKRRGKLELRV